MDTVRLKHITDRFTVYRATSAAAVDPALARRVCDALGQQTVFVHKVTIQRLARQLAQEYHIEDMKALLYDVTRTSTHT